MLQILFNKSYWLIAIRSVQDKIIQNVESYETVIKENIIGLYF